MLVHGDCRKILRELSENSVGSFNTDPPYEIKILGEEWDATGIAFDPDVWREHYRVLKPGGYLAAFAAPKKYHRLACAIEDAGFEVRDVITWLKGGPCMPHGGRPGPQIDKALGAERPVIGSRVLTGTAALSTKERGGTHSVGVDSRGAKKTIAVTAPGSPESEQWKGYGYNLASGTELICLAQKPCDGPIARNILKWGVGALNVDLAGAPGNGRGVWQWPRNVIVTHHPKCTRKACHSGCPSRIIGEQSGRCPSAGNKRSTSSKGAAHGSMGRKEWSPEQVSKGDDGTAARYFPTFFYSKKTAKYQKTIGGRVVCPVKTVKPWDVIKWLVQLTTPPGELCADGFMGSGTTGISCAMLGVPFYGIEMKPSHFVCALRRNWFARRLLMEGSL